ncbi:MAG TPA: glycosyltransferase family 39 protein, partial [Streptosporangiaceae bacterium]|nr:glycosyltransferase family 39 protein [Streptosporangiaceae bacterium]
WAALLSLRELAHLVNNVDAVHGLYYLLMHGWVAVGSSPAALRVPSVAAMTGAAVVIAVLARRLTGSGWAALFAGLVMVLTPDISYYAQTARSYAMVYACVAAATLVLVHALAAEAAGAPGPRLARWWIGYAALVTLGGYLNEMSLLMLAAHAVTVLLARHGRQSVRHWAAAGGAAAVLVTPLILVSIREHAAVNWIPRPGLQDLRILFHDYFGATTAAGVLLLGCAIVAVLPSRSTWRWWRGQGGGTGAGASASTGSASTGGATTGGSAGPGATTGAGGAGAGGELAWWRSGGVSLASVGAPLLVLPALLLILESLLLPPLYVDRYVLYGEAGAALLAGAGMWRIGQWLSRTVRWPALLWVPGAVICACTLVLQLGPQQRARTPESRLYNFGGPSQYVGANERPGDGVLFFGTFFRKARLGYPQDFASTTDFAMSESPEQAGTFRGHDKPFAATYPLMLRYSRIWVVGHLPSAHAIDPVLRAESVVLQHRFRMIAERRFRGITVTLWQRR